MLRAGFIAHLGVVVDGTPMVIPTSYGFDDDTLYLHGSVASRSLAPDGRTGQACVTITLVDGLVLARSVFEHAVNYRSAMIYGTPRLVTDAGREAARPAAAVRAPGSRPVGLCPAAEPQGAGRDHRCSRCRWTRRR